jgi:hypothetical protein
MIGQCIPRDFLSFWHVCFFQAVFIVHLQFLNIFHKTHIEKSVKKAWKQSLNLYV